MLKVLLITPTPRASAADRLACSLQAAGYAVERTALDGASKDMEAALLRAFSERPPDLLFADLSTTPSCLPLLQARRLLRQTWGEDMPQPPCLALFAFQHLALPDWQAHTDDFLLPPYDPSEVLARLALLLFRKRHIEAQNRLVFADLTLDLTSLLAFDKEGKILALTPREFEFLQFLVTHRGKFFSRTRLLDLVWGLDFEGGERTVDIHVRRLRAKLPPRTAALLETRRGVGYGFRLP